MSKQKSKVESQFLDIFLFLHPTRSAKSSVTQATSYKYLGILIQLEDMLDSVWQVTSLS